MNSTKYNRTESKISTSSSANNNYLDSQLKQAALEAESDFDDTSVAYQYDANEPNENEYANFYIIYFTFSMPLYMNFFLPFLL